jgi:hypothetical protein
MLHAKKGSSYVTKARKRSRCVAFWRHYYAENCQVVSPTVRLRPTNLVQRHLYNEDFTKFWDKLYPNDKLPSLRTFESAMKHPDFRDVSRRDKHTHVRCATCAELRALKRKAFNTQQGMEGVQARMTDHEVSCWRAGTLWLSCSFVCRTLYDIFCRAWF